MFSEDIEHCGIRDVALLPLKIIPTQGGDVLRMIREGSPLLPDFHEKFGEIYFSEVLPGRIKAWKQHKRQNQLFAVPTGRIKLALCDARAASDTLGVIAEFILGRPDNYKLLRIPAGVWYGFQCVSDTPALICNLADMVHDPAEVIRIDVNDPAIPFSW